MDKILKTNVTKVKDLNKKADRGSLDSFKLILKVASLCSQGYNYWKTNKKELDMKRDDLLKAYGYKKTYFNQLVNVAQIDKEKVKKYIKQEKEMYSVPKLIKFVKPEKEEEKVKILYQVQELTTGAKMTIDESYKIELKKCDNATMLGTLDFIISQLEEQRDKLLPTIELSEAVEA
tara:strand:+ start:105 stop:632 length:528 start_codon:yes stop_codon:yes gene_type:complete